MQTMKDFCKNQMRKKLESIPLEIIFEYLDTISPDGKTIITNGKVFTFSVQRK